MFARCCELQATRLRLEAKKSRAEKREMLGAGLGRRLWALLALLAGWSTLLNLPEAAWAIRTRSHWRVGGQQLRRRIVGSVAWTRPAATGDGNGQWWATATGNGRQAVGRRDRAGSAAPGGASESPARHALLHHHIQESKRGRAQEDRQETARLGDRQEEDTHSAGGPRRLQPLCYRLLPLGLCRLVVRVQPSARAQQLRMCSNVAGSTHTETTPSYLVYPVYLVRR